MSHKQPIVRSNPFLRQLNEAHHYETFRHSSSDSDSDNENNENNENNTNINTNTNTNNNNTNNDTNNDNDDDDIIIHLINKRKNNKTSQTLNYNYKKENAKIFIRVWFITLIIVFIMIMLIYGIIDLYRSNEIIYGQIGFYTFQIYYIIHVGWYAIFLIIHIFLILTQLCYSMTTTNYINHIILNYSHIRYTIIVKTLFAISIIIILYMNYIDFDTHTISNNDDVTNVTNASRIPLYYNFIYIETILSFLLMLCIDDICLINTLKNIHNTML